jgi:hypothetical protein
MGGTFYSADVTTSYVADKTSRGMDFMAHTDDVRSGRVACTVHELLDPSKLNKAGENVRESCDSAAHPDSVPVAILFDVTGSMATAPRIFVEKLPALMAALIKKGYLEHPHILFGAIGDATCDKVPLQIGQFEGGNEMDQALVNIFLEGGGGGQDTESYELGMYYMARHTKLDSLDKRGKKGYLFLIGDERPYPQVSRSQVKKLIGDSLQDDIDTEDILAELREKFEVYWLMPGGTSHFTDRDVIEPLTKMFGQNFRKLEVPEDICTFITGIIGVEEGFDIDDIKTDMLDVGAGTAAVDRMTKDLTVYASTKPVRRTATATGDLVPAGTDAVEKL